MGSAIALIGLPGGGKSTVGRQLAKRLKARFVDSDAVLEDRIGMPIRSFFEQHGEALFRDHEEAVIDELTASMVQLEHTRTLDAGSDTVVSLVLATGGGAVLRPVNRARLHARTSVVYLRSTPEELYRRLKHDTQRPLLQVKDPMAKLRELYDLRHPLYEETAHHCVDTGRPSVGALVNIILAQLGMADLVNTLPPPQVST